VRSVLIFDLDDTLFPERDFVVSGFRAADVWLQQERSRSGFFGEALRLFEAGVRGHIFDEALQKIGADPDPVLIQRLVLVYRAHKPRLALYPDARRAIDHFRGHKKLGLITDGYAVPQRNKVEALGIGDAFDIVVYSDELGRNHWKPSPAPYQKVMETLGCDGTDCVYVGDNPVKDFITARNLDWMTVRVRRNDGQHSQVETGKDFDAEWTVESLGELVKLPGVGLDE